MKKLYQIIMMLLGWFAVGMQFILRMQNLETSASEAVIRFFSYFTILTNSLVAIYFTIIVGHSDGTLSRRFESQGTLTAITAFILIVGIVYQVALRNIWDPQGMQRIVDELLHTVIPGFVLFYWIAFRDRNPYPFREVSGWLLYPLIYLTFILLRGSASGFYPYPFLDVPTIGPRMATKNILAVILLTLMVMTILYLLDRRRIPKTR